MVPGQVFLKQIQIKLSLHQMWKPSVWDLTLLFFQVRKLMDESDSQLVKMRGFGIVVRVGCLPKVSVFNEMGIRF